MAAQQSHQIGREREKKPMAPGELETPAIVFREFSGMNVQSPRQSIKDDQFFWIENVQPIAFGNLPTVAAPSAALTTLAGESVTAAFTANVSGSDFHYAFCASGAAEVRRASSRTNATAAPTSVLQLSWALTLGDVES